MTTPTKSLLVIVSAHHSADNIASLRFKGLSKYLDSEKYDVHVITKSLGPVVSRLEANGVVAHHLPGELIGGSLGVVRSLFGLAASILPALPYAWKMDKTWLTAAISHADQLVEAASRAGADSVIVGTYSPVDALIVAKCVGARRAIPVVLDFRDGLTFESMGRKGILAAMARRCVESAVVRSASLLTAVSRPIVNDFRKRYPRQWVEMLPNGFDPEESSEPRALADQASRIAASLPDNKLCFGHFGRIGASDATRLDSLAFLVSALNRANVENSVHMLFVGQLLEQEIETISRLKCTSSIVPTVSRDVAQSLMRMTDALLLITGAGVGCATGKIFEYIAAGPPIICVSRVMNEAAMILDETDCGFSVLTGDDASVERIIHQLINKDVRLSRNAAAIESFNRASQARRFGEWIEKCLEDFRRRRISFAP